MHIKSLKRYNELKIAIYESLICGELTVTKNILRMDTSLEVILHKLIILGKSHNFDSIEVWCN